MTDMDRLQRIQEARRAGWDADDLCAEGYPQGVGCAACARESRRMVAGIVALVVAAAVVVVALAWVVT